MTEYELIDALGTYSSGMQAWTATYFSGATAYLITAYVAGNKLTKLQAITISSGFTLFAIICTMVIFGLGIRLVEFTDELRELRPDHIYVTSELGIIMVTSVFVCGIAASLKFMWDVRRPEE